MLQLLRASASAKLRETLRLVMTQCWITLSPHFVHCGFCGQIGSTPGSLLALSSSLFVPLFLSSAMPQYTENWSARSWVQTHKRTWSGSATTTALRCIWTGLHLRYNTKPSYESTFTHLLISFNLLSCVSFSLSSPGIQPRPGQCSSKEEETRRSPTHSEHWPCGSTWWSQQVSSSNLLLTIRPVKHTQSENCIVTNH